MFERNPINDEWFYFIENQAVASSGERLELFSGLRARYGNLIREEIISVVLEYKGLSYWIHIIATDAPDNTLLIDSYVPHNTLDQTGVPDIKNLLEVAHHWVSLLIWHTVAREFDLFSPYALALIESTSNDANEFQELTDSLAKERAEKNFYCSLAMSMAGELAPAVYAKIVSQVTAKYKSRPDSGMGAEECTNEWQELGCMLSDGTHLLLEMGLDQLRCVVHRSIKALSCQDRLALWCHYGEETQDFVNDAEPDESFDLTDDSDNFDRIIENIVSSLTANMVHDWEDEPTNMENNSEDDEIAEFEAELNALKLETEIETFWAKLNDIAGRVEIAGLTEEMDVILNEMTGLMVEAERKDNSSIMIEVINEPREKAIVPSAMNSITESQGNPLKDAFKFELKALESAIDIETLDKQLDDVMERLDKAGLSDSLDKELNDAVDRMTVLLAGTRRI